MAGRELIPGAGKILASISPRAAALAVMSMLAFGVVVGSGASSLAGSGTPLLLAVSPTPQAAAPVDAPGRQLPGRLRSLPLLPLPLLRLRRQRPPRPSSR